MSLFSQDVIRKLPKTDLHCHFDGSLRLSTVIELAQKNKVKLPSYDKDSLMKLMGYGTVRHTLEEYLVGFAPLVDVIQNVDDIERAFFEVCEDAAEENVWHLELRYCPYLLTKKGLTSKEVVAACLRASEKAERELPMTVRHILCGLKHDTVDKILEVAKIASFYHDRGVVAFDLAGPEVGYPIKDHEEAINFAKSHHLFITMHAGENSGPDNIIEALNGAGAHRIGHGTSLLNDEKLLNYVVNHRIGIESCPISNLHTGSVKSLSLHPIKSFLEKNVRVSINTDNRLVSDTTITKEILTIKEYLHIDGIQLKKLLVNGFKSAFLPYKNKAEYLRKFEEAWAKIERPGL